MLTLDEAQAIDWDIALATWWATTSALFRLRAERHAYFIQLLEDSTYPTGAPEQLAAAMTTGLPVRFITEARWIAELLEDLQPGNHVLYVRNGIPKEVFASPASIAPALPRRAAADRPGGRARLRPQGRRRRAGRGRALMREPAHVTWVSPHRGEPPAGVDRILAGLSHAEMAALFAESPRPAQALARRGHVRPAAGGLSHGRDGRDHGGYRP